ncbi:MAG TPA: hypothetical protein VK427_23150 [Kofleriaceae bacterium]|nr:hypothetical protein [Kofleriaceae bacterium]
MSRATKVLAGTTILGFAASIWLYVDNSSLREEVADKTATIEKANAPQVASASDDAEYEARKARDAKIAFNPNTPAPTLDGKKEHRLERRARRTEEFAAMFGREEGETEEQWRQRVMPLVSAGLIKARLRTNDNRKVAEEKAGVTPEQSRQIDAALEKVYGDVLDYTNKAVKDGQLSPYERNVSGWLDFAGGLGGILNDTQGQIGKILTPAQIKAMYDAGFEWGEYMGAQVPWEQMGAPPPRK